MKRAFSALRRFITFFLLSVFLISCCLMVFIKTLEHSIGREFTQSEISGAAIATAINLTVISVLLTVINLLYRRLAVDRPVRLITQAAERIMKGDFSVRIKQRRILSTDERFKEIINCFNKMAGELSGVETLRTDFMANVSHEMKTPLAVMQNYATLLQEPSLPEEKRVLYAKAISRTARKMADMITNILKLSSLENQQFFTQTTKFDLGELIRECLLQYESTWESADIKIGADIAESVQIQADSQLLLLVLSNLFSNAFKFTEPGGSVFVSMTANESTAVIKVKDTGCGMTPEVGRHIFEKFYQGDTSHSSQGNGLGLALVKRVIDIMHGEIQVESAVGVGTTFTVVIPRF